MTNVASRLDTNTEFLQGLIQDVKKGEIKIPKFQRRFVWTSRQALDLLDSMAHNYPIGSLLFWKTTVKLVAERNLGDFMLPATDDLTPTNYVLDGQQRLTVIYSCLGAPLDGLGFSAGYDLLKEEFIELSGIHQIHIFPMRWLYETTRLLDFRTALKSHPDASKLQERLDLLIQILSNYKIPVVVLKELTVEEVCPIFERINSSGTRLSTYDLMVAATWSESFDLNDKTEEISDTLSTKSFQDIDGDTILKCLSAIKKNSVNRDEILNLRKIPAHEMDKLVVATKETLLKAIDTLTTEFGIYSWDFLPYEALVVILSFIYSKEPKLTASQTKRVREWFWRASFAERYRGASDSYISKDLQAVYAYVISGNGTASYFGEVPSNETLQNVEFRSNNSRSRAFVLALATQRPRNITNAMIIDTTEALSVFNKKQFHHIYPKAFLRNHQISGEPNSIVNITMLAASENNLISDENPNAYLPRLINDHKLEAESIFASNLLPSPGSVDYSTLTYQEFCFKRSALIYGLVKKLCNGGIVQDID